jgi:hypothetical protein
MAKIIINRKGQYRNRMRAIRVVIDGNEVGTVKNDSSEEFTVEPGKHTVQCKIDWCGSQVFEVDVKADEVKMLKLQSGMKYYSAMSFTVILIIVVSFLYRKALHRDLPDWWYYFEMSLFGIILLYLAYYFTLGRYKYLSIGEDKDTIFNS